MTGSLPILFVVLILGSILSQTGLALTSPAALVSVNQIQLIRLSLQYWNRKVPGINLKVRDGVNINDPQVQAAIDREFLLMQFWFEGAVQTMSREFRFLEANPATEDLRTLICTGLSCGGGSRGSACGPAC